MKITEKDLEDMISGLKGLMTSSQYAHDTCGFVDHKGNPLCPDPVSTRYLHEDGVSEANRILQLLDSLKMGETILVVVECQKCGRETSDPEIYDTNPSWVGEPRDIVLCKKCYREKIA